MHFLAVLPFRAGLNQRCAQVAKSYSRSEDPVVGRRTNRSHLRDFFRAGGGENLNGRNLSGGEQQMLAVGRALMTNARLILLDEATEGLAPLVCAEIWRCLERLKAVGQAILLIDSNHGALMQIADRHYIMEKGRITWTGDSAALAAAEEVRHRYLGV